ncbi:hypothetical protein CEXT_558221 [Caerostris extrusa]|uniref:Uncharacterized protein n=1 Tax=Caerostris extrusa TaxID=172846 RepID=A0AAV4WA85_CAEEX|nr:hypothetical protein CEXT_558221 [Caerostris extrusa]
MLSSPMAHHRAPAAITAELALSSPQLREPALRQPQGARFLANSAARTVPAPSSFQDFSRVRCRCLIPDKKEAHDPYNSLNPIYFHAELLYKHASI